MLVLYRRLWPLTRRVICSHFQGLFAKTKDFMAQNLTTVRCFRSVVFYKLSEYYRGGALVMVIWSTRNTVTLSIFKFSAWFFAQIVENRKTQLSSPFLSPGDIFSKSYDENRFVWQLYGIWDLRIRPARRRHAPRPLRPNLVFVITFRKNVPRT